MRRFLGCVLIAVISALCSSTLYAQDMCADQSSTSEGPVVGFTAPNGRACAYEGIPYAAPPVGELRFRATEAAKPRDKVLKALAYGPSCIQVETVEAGGMSPGFSEDCLTINIWRPKKEGKFPVMFWIHGGGFFQGSGSYQMYNGANLAADKDVVVVSFNYRLGVLGFLALPELAKEDPNGSTGNYGMLDQIQALKWVKDNVASFGGDPNNVTIFGQSAGGVSVCNLLATPLAAGLFHKAIEESGACDMVTGLDSGYREGIAYAKAIDCRESLAVDCLRQKQAKSLASAKGIKSWPHVDGYVFKAKPIQTIKSGNFNHVPVMLGYTRDEFKLVAFMRPYLKYLPGCVIKRVMKKQMGPVANEVPKYYSMSDYKKPIYYMLAVVNDGFGSRAYSAAEALSTQTPTYFYRFDWDDIMFGDKVGAFHGLEIPLVFRNLDLDKVGVGLFFSKPRYVAAAKPVSEMISSYWTNFAKTGDPNGAGLTEWPKYDAGNKKLMFLDAQATTNPLDDKNLNRFNFLVKYDIEELVKNVL